MGKDWVECLGSNSYAHGCSPAIDNALSGLP
jgi:hypothetical protein